MSISEINALICLPLRSSGDKKKLTVEDAHGLCIERWKLSCLLGVSSHRLPESYPRLIRFSANAIKCINACSHSSEPPTDGALFSSSQHWRRSLHSLHTRLLRSLNSYGIGAAGLVEGTLGLLLVAGSLALGARVLWQKASQIASMPKTYEAVIEFPFASGITIGTVVRMRGVDMGTVINVRPCLERIDVRIQVMDSAVYIPRNALVEVNQSGLSGETQIDITPMSPVPHPSVGPLDADCASEGLIVCDKERIRGKQGVSMDDLMRLCGKMARKTKDTDLNELFKTAKQIGSAVDSSKPLLEKIETFVEDVEPVVKELQDGRLLKDVTELLEFATQSAHRLRVSRFTAENRRLLLDLVANLTTTLKRLESTSEDIGNILGHDKNRKNMKHLVQLLSRLVDA